MKSVISFFMSLLLGLTMGFSSSDTFQEEAYTAPEITYAAPADVPLFGDALSMMDQGMLRYAAMQEIDSKTKSTPEQRMTKKLRELLEIDVSKPCHAIILSFNTMIPSPGYYDIYYPDQLSDAAQEILMEFAFNLSYNLFYKSLELEEHSATLQINAVQGMQITPIDASNELRNYSTVYLFYPTETQDRYDVGIVTYQVVGEYIFSRVHYLGDSGEHGKQYIENANQLLDDLIHGLGGVSPDSDPELIVISMEE